MDIKEKIIKEIEKNSELSKENKQKFIKELNENPIALCHHIQIENYSDEILEYSDTILDMYSGFDLPNFLTKLDIDYDDYFIDSMYYGECKFISEVEAMNYSYDYLYEFVTENIVNDKKLQYVL